MNHWFSRLTIVAIAALSFIPFLNGVHLFDWDEINFAEAAREMIVSGNYSTVTIDYKPFWEKPPLFFWMQAASMKVFGINEFGARFPNAIAGIFTLLLFFELGKKLRNITFGLVWSFMYLVSFLPQFYFKSGIIDPWFNLFIFLGITLTYFYLNSKKPFYFFLGGLAIGLAVLTKGPVGLLIYLLTGFVFFAFQKFKNLPPFSHILLFLVGVISFGGGWIISETIQGRFYIIQDFFEYQIRLLQKQDAGHGGPFYYHFFVLLIGCFPLSAFAIENFVGKVKPNNTFGFLMKILFWVVLILFSIVNTKIIHYSSLCYFPLSFLATAGFMNFVIQNNKRLTNIFLSSLWVIWIVILFGLVWIGINIDKLPELITIKDKFAASSLQYPTPFSHYDYLPVMALLGGFIFFFFHKEPIRKGTIALSFSFISFMLAMALIVPKVEVFSQGGAVDFLKQHRNELVYPLGFKSYAHLFYTEKKPYDNPEYHDVNLALSKPFNHPIFFYTKIQKAERFEKAYPFLEKIDEDRGFVFYKKSPR